MARNVEVKARLDGLDAARDAADRLGARFVWVDEQVDRYYQVGDGGRVKLPRAMHVAGVDGALCVPLRIA